MADAISTGAGAAASAAAAPVAVAIGACGKAAPAASAPGGGAGSKIGGGSMGGSKEKPPWRWFEPSLGRALGKADVATIDVDLVDTTWVQEVRPTEPNRSLT